MPQKRRFSFTQPTTGFIFALGSLLMVVLPAIIPAVIRSLHGSVRTALTGFFGAGILYGVLPALAIICAGIAFYVYMNAKDRSETPERLTKADKLQYSSLLIGSLTLLCAIFELIFFVSVRFYNTSGENRTVGTSDVTDFTSPSVQQSPRYSVVTPDSAVLTIGRRRNSRTGSPDLLLLKSTIAGNKLWEKIIPAANGIAAYQPDGSLRLCLTGSGALSPAWMEIRSAKGDSLTAVSYSVGANPEWQAMIVNPDGTILIRGVSRDSSSSLFFLKTDRDGGQIWLKRLPELGRFVCDNPAHSLLATDGGYMSVGTASEGGMGFDRLLMFRIDTVGNLLWSNKKGDQLLGKGIGICLKGDGSFWVLNQGPDTTRSAHRGWRNRLLDVTSDGGIRAVYTLDTPSPGWNMHDLISWKGDGALVAGTGYPPATGYSATPNDQWETYNVIAFDRSGKQLISFHGETTELSDCTVANLSAGNYLITGGFVPKGKPVISASQGLRLIRYIE